MLRIRFFIHNEAHHHGLWESTVLACSSVKNFPFFDLLPGFLKGFLKFNKSFARTNTFIIPNRDIKTLLDKELRENQTLEARPYKIAEPVSVDIDVAKQAEWTQDEILEVQEHHTLIKIIE